MGYRATVFGVTKVALDDHYWVEIKPLTKAESDECQRVLLGGELEGALGDGQALRARLHQREYTDQLLLCAIARWNLDDEQGAVLPITLETIQGLAEEHATRLLAVVRRLESPLSDGAAAKN